MSEKMTCPSCDSHTSSVLNAYMGDEPCPACGLPAEAARTVLAARSRNADEELVAKAMDAITRAERAERDLRVANWRLEKIREAMDAPAPDYLTQRPGVS